MTRTNNAREAALRAKTLNDERVDMVKRHAPPAAIHAVSAAYLIAYEEAFGGEPDECCGSCAPALVRK